MATFGTVDTRTFGELFGPSGTPRTFGAHVLAAGKAFLAYRHKSLSIGHIGASRRTLGASIKHGRIMI